jgi:hypothetical protein
MLRVSRDKDGDMKKTLGLVAMLAVAWLPAAPAAAQALDAASQAALSATLQLLQDPTQRNAAIAGSPQATATDQQIQAMLKNPELQQEFYALTAAVFAELVQSSGGDVNRMTQILTAAQTDPAGFVASLSPQTAERLHAFASKISDQKP